MSDATRAEGALSSPSGKPLTDDEARLADLIARVEKATGPDREIDLAVQRETRSCVVPAHEIHLEGANCGYAFHDSPVHETGYCLGLLPKFTASLDAVVALVERELPKRGWVVGKEGVDGRDGPYMAIIERPGSVDFTAQHKTPALALLLAFLRAKEKSR